MAALPCDKTSAQGSNRFDYADALTEICSLDHRRFVRAVCYFAPGHLLSAMWNPEYVKLQQNAVRRLLRQT